MNHRPVTEKRRSNNGGGESERGEGAEGAGNFDIVGLLTPRFRADPLGYVAGCHGAPLRLARANTPAGAISSALLFFHFLPLLFTASSVTRLSLSPSVCPLPL